MGKSSALCTRKAGYRLDMQEDTIAVAVAQAGRAPARSVGSNVKLWVGGRADRLD